MVSYFNEDAQLFYAVTSKGDRVYLGYGPSRAEAVDGKPPAGAAGLRTSAREHPLPIPPAPDPASADGCSGLLCPGRRPV